MKHDACSVAVVGIKPVTPLISFVLVSVMGTQKKSAAVIDDSSALWQSRAYSLIKHRCFSMIHNQCRLSHCPKRNLSELMMLYWASLN